MGRPEKATLVLLHTPNVKLAAYSNVQPEIISDFVPSRAIAGKAEFIYI